MSMLIRNPNTLLVLDGVPYSLVRQVPINYCSPCTVCDLSDICCGQDDSMSLRKLCTPAGLGESYFFKEDWEAVKSSVIKYLHIDQCPVEIK